MANKEDLRKAVLSQMYLIKAQLETILFMIEELEKEEEEKCIHPKEFRKNYTTMGGPEEWVCGLCGYHYQNNKEEE